MPLTHSSAERQDLEAFNDAILEYSLDPMIVIDGRGEILAASRSVERVFGYDRSDLLGSNIRRLMPEPHHSRHDDYLEHYRRTGETNILGRTREFQVVRKGGELIDIELSVARVEVPGRGSAVFMGSFRDITDRTRIQRALARSERRLHAVFDQSFQYMGLVAPDGTLLEANRTSLEGTGVTREEVIGKLFWDTRWWGVSEETRQACRDAVRRAAAGEFVRFETQHRGPADETLTIDFSLTPVLDDDGSVVHLIPEGRDITELKRAQRTETAMLRALATIGESAAVLAHEIKNPITSVNVALRAVADQLGEDQQVVLQDLVQRMQRLERVMRRTLSFTKPVELQRSDADAEELARGVIDELRPTFAQVDVDVLLAAPDEPITLHVDRQLVGEVLTNLVSNGLEALAEHGGSKVVVSISRDRDRTPRFVVEDDGPGIPESLRPTLFKPFYTTKAKGSGLGLAFCKKVVDEHGGTITVDDGELGGARFTVRLPTKT